MKPHEELKAWDRLADLLTSEEVVSKEQLAGELAAESVDVKTGGNLLRAIVRTAVQNNLREEAERERSARQNDFDNFERIVSSWSFAKIKEWLDASAAGIHGDEVRNLACAFHRGKEDRPLTEEEARSLVLDMLRSSDIARKHLPNQSA